MSKVTEILVLLKKIHSEIITASKLCEEESKNNPHFGKFHANSILQIAELVQHNIYSIGGKTIDPPVKSQPSDSSALRASLHKEVAQREKRIAELDIAIKKVREKRKQLEGVNKLFGIEEQLEGESPIDYANRLLESAEIDFQELEKNLKESSEADIPDFLKDKLKPKH